jgi:phosphosulfolactate phosphohydrolase-like enzyme/phospholipid N-methyltransferase
MPPSLHTLLSPAEFAALTPRELAGTTCVVFDVLRATSTFVTALANGAAAVHPVADIAAALALRGQLPGALLGGERAGRRIGAAESGGVAFDLGNSPREYTPERVGGRAIISTTTNGTRALRACAGAAAVLAGSLLNLDATAAWLRARAPGRLLLVCAGTGEEAATEDVLAAGALAGALLEGGEAWEPSDATQCARAVYRFSAHDLPAAMRCSRNARRLLAMPDLSADVACCLRCNALPIVVAQGGGGGVTSGGRVLTGELHAGGVSSACRCGDGQTRWPAADSRAPLCGLGSGRGLPLRCAACMSEGVSLKQPGTSMFVTEMLLYPQQVGAILPSSRHLSGVMADWLPADPDAYVLELGPGTGAVTRALLTRGLRPERLIAIEMSARMARALRGQFPKAHILTGDACNLDKLLRRHLREVTTVGAVISSLPLRMFSDEAAKTLATRIRQVLHPEGRWVQYSYWLGNPRNEALAAFERCASRLVWRNFPPARVTVYRRKSPTRPPAAS